MKEIIAGSKKPKQEAHAVLDPRTGEKDVSIEEIKRVNLEHCVDVLKHNTLTKEAEKLKNIEADLHKILMEDEKDADTNLSKDQYDMMLEKLKVRNKRGYDFLIKAGKGFLDSIFKFCKRMLSEEQFPARFSETILYNL